MDQSPEQKLRTANVTLAGFMQHASMRVNQGRTDFGRRGREDRALSARTYPAAEWVLVTGRAVGIFGLTSLALLVAGAIFWMLQSIERLNADTSRAERKVIEIVNEPITHLPRSGPVEIFSPGWFHPGAIRPDFANVDVRATQQFPYSGYVTSDLNPSEMFIGSELEFNPMTKYFYVDRTLPKKRLSETEMTEINGLYRLIGHGDTTLAAQWSTIAGLVAFEFCLGAIFLLLIRRTH